METQQPNHANQDLESALDRVRQVIVLYIKHGGTEYFSKLIDAFATLENTLNNQLNQIRSDIQRNADTIRDNQHRLDKLDGRDTRKVKPRKVTIEGSKYLRYGMDWVENARITRHESGQYDVIHLPASIRLANDNYRITIEQID